MCEKFIEDKFFKELFNRYFYNGIDEEAMIMIDFVIRSQDSEIVFNTLNIIKAAVISELSFKESYKKIRNYIDDRGVSFEIADKFILTLILKFLISMNSEGIETLLLTKRDFIKEVISQKLKISIDDVTEDQKKNAIEHYMSMYSIEEPSVKSWDEYFLNMSVQSARNSKCLSRRIGAVLVKDKSILSTGYNGPPRGIPRCDLRWSLDKSFFDKYKNNKLNSELCEEKCPRHVLGAESGELLEMCIAGHAEENAILNAARMGICTKDTILYMSCGIPCFRCIIKIINAGISEIVVTGINFYDDNSEYLINNSKLKVRLYNF
jgi:dCMP deaminase